MFSVPLGLAGVGLALRLTGTSLSVNSFMGIIMMVGIVVSNGVLLVDFANVLRRSGKPLVEATIEAGKGRLYDPAVVDACLRLFRQRGYQLPGQELRS